VTASIERLEKSPADTLGALIAESERFGLSFVRKLADEWTSGTNRFDGPGELLIVARRANELVGVCGLNIDPYAGGLGVGRVRHLYVLSAHRHGGVGEQLVRAIVEAARDRFHTLRLRTFNPAAARLYERMGFERRSDVPDCTHVMDLEATR
jgi:GNAT superfamily N-acetyltransferase